MTDPLEPLRAALRARAEAAADQLRAAAEEDGRRLVATANEEAASLLAGARAQGAADADAQLAADRARSRHAARSVVLDAQRAAYERMRRQARDAVRRLLDDPAERARLAAIACRQLGDHAVVHDQPAGGVLAEAADGRRIDASVDALVDSAVSRLDLDQLWAAP